MPHQKILIGWTTVGSAETAEKLAATLVGTCLAAIAGPGGTVFKAFNLFGSRTEMQIRGGSWTLDYLRRVLAGTA